MLSEKAKKAGIMEYLMKPVVRQELAEVARRVLDAKAEGMKGMSSSVKSQALTQINCVMERSFMPTF